MTGALVGGPAADAGGPPSLLIRHAGKTFGSTRVLQDVTLRIEPGEIHGLVGRNGSGKSTLIKILTGYHEPDPGAELEVRGVPRPLPASPPQLRAAGIAVVHQDLALIGELSIWENVLVGRYRSGAVSPVRFRAERARARAALRRFGVSTRLERPTAGLAPVERALVAIARAFLDVEEHGGVLILDEPTAFQPVHDAERLFAAIREVAAQGVGVLFVSHRLNEVLALTHRVTVLRNGEVVDDRSSAEHDETTLIEAILGEPLDDFYPEIAPSAGAVLLEASGVSGVLVRDFALSARAGEVIGVTGLAGAGHDDVPYLLAAAAPQASGELVVEGATLDLAHRTPVDTRRLGVALLPADRGRQSGVPELSITDNVINPVLGALARFSVVSRRAARTWAGAVVRDFGVQPARIDLPLRALSGGNQQKALLGKWLRTEPRVLLLHEPSQGVDVGAKKEIFAQIERAAAHGTTVIIASAEAEDLAHLCHRVTVLREGRVAGELSGARLTETGIAQLALRDTASNPITSTVTTTSTPGGPS